MQDTDWTVLRHMENIKFIRNVAPSFSWKFYKYMVDTYNETLLSICFASFIYWTGRKTQINNIKLYKHSKQIQLN